MHEVRTSGGLRLPLRPTGRLVLAYGHYRSCFGDTPWFQYSDVEAVLPARALQNSGSRQRYFRAVSQYAKLGLLDYDDRLPKELQPTGRRIRPEGRPTPYKYIRLNELGRTALLEDELSRPPTKPAIGQAFIPEIGRLVDQEIATLVGRPTPATVEEIMAALSRPRETEIASELIVVQTGLVEQ